VVGWSSAEVLLIPSAVRAPWPLCAVAGTRAATPRFGPMVFGMSKELVSREPFHRVTFLCVQ
jgi:hypothetical protein